MPTDISTFQANPGPTDMDFQAPVPQEPVDKGVEPGPYVPRDPDEELSLPPATFSKPYEKVAKELAADIYQLTGIINELERKLIDIRDQFRVSVDQPLMRLVQAAQAMDAAADLLVQSTAKSEWVDHGRQDDWGQQDYQGEWFNEDTRPALEPDPVPARGLGGYGATSFGTYASSVLGDRVPEANRRDYRLVKVTATSTPRGGTRYLISEIGSPIQHVVYEDGQGKWKCFSCNRVLTTDPSEPIAYDQHKSMIEVWLDNGRPAIMRLSNGRVVENAPLPGMLGGYGQVGYEPTARGPRPGRSRPVGLPEISRDPANASIPVRSKTIQRHRSEHGLPKKSPFAAEKERQVKRADKMEARERTGFRDPSDYPGHEARKRLLGATRSNSGTRPTSGQPKRAREVPSGNHRVVGLAGRSGPFDLHDPGIASRVASLYSGSKIFNPDGSKDFKVIRKGDH